MKKKSRKFARSSVIPLIGLAVIAASLLAGCSSGNQGFWNEIELEDVDLNSVLPGTYTGEYETGPVRAVVSVKVEGGRIQYIEIALTR